jgi:hypothetical protein
MGGAPGTALVVVVVEVEARRRNAACVLAGVL